MADNKIVEARREDLIIDADTEEYILRYRIVSEDRNRTSAWSPVYRIPAPTINQILFENSLIDDLGQRLFDEPVYSTNNSTASGTVANVFWNSPSIFGGDGRRYDLYVKWGVYDTNTAEVVYDNDYQYLKSVSIQSLSFAKPDDKSGYDRVSIWVQSTTYPKKIVENQRVFLLADQSI